MTALDTNMGGATIGGTLAATLGTLTAGGNLQGNTKKIAKSFQNAWRGAAAYHFYMLALRQLYNGEDDDEDDDHEDDDGMMIEMMTMMILMMRLQQYSFAIPSSVLLTTQLYGYMTP